MPYDITTHDMDYERSRVARLEGLAADWTAPGADPVTLADLPVGDEDEGIEVMDIIESIVTNGNITRVVIAPNHTGPLAEALAAHLRHYVSFQQHVVTAALSGDRKAALRLPAGSDHAVAPRSRRDTGAARRDARSQQAVPAAVRALVSRGW